MIHRCFFIAAALALLPLTVSAQLLTTEQKLDDYHQLVQNIRASYGPYEFKTRERVVDVPAHIAKFESRIAATTGNTDYYDAMLEFVAGFKDGHFSIFVPSTQRALIPVTTDLFEGKVLLIKIDREKLPEAKFPFQIGDEIVNFNGRPVAEEIDRLALKVASGNDRSVKRMAAWQLLRRSGARMNIPAEKEVTLTIRRGTTALLEDVKLPWTVTGEAVDENLAATPKHLFSRVPSVATRFGTLANDQLVRVSELADIDFACNPKTRIAVPTHAEWILKEPFTAYTYPTAKGRVGYLRIPHYYPQAKPGQTSAAAFEEWFEAYRFAVKKLEATTVGLIIDQDHNCGGSVKLVEDMAALFINRPFAPTQFSLKATKAEVVDFKSWTKTAPEGSLEAEYYRKMATILESTWKKSPGSMTEKIYLTGRDLVPVDQIANYTKPIVMLIDDMAGSGGDAFPSMMKGEGRAKLFGQQTSGLGGSVAQPPALNNTAMHLSMTATLFFKPDGTPVENNGAIPDRYYEITREDLLLQFRPYQKAYTDYLLEQLP